MKLAAAPESKRAGMDRITGQYDIMLWALESPFWIWKKDESLP